MKKYTVEVSENARFDLLNLNNAIIYQYKSPSTAVKYMRGLAKEIKKLELNAEAFTIQTRKSLTNYGQNVRRINYKKMAIIYTVHQNTVYIHRIIPASMIAGLL